MGGSIHIHKTGSSIIDTIFVCRITGKIPRRWIVETPEEIAGLVHEDLEALRAGAVRPTQGDTHCIIFGHMIRLAIWQLRKTWDRHLPVSDKLSRIDLELQKEGGFNTIKQFLNDDLSQSTKFRHEIVREHEMPYGTCDDDISF